MSNYRRIYVHGGTYFITQVTYQRQPWLCYIHYNPLRHGLCDRPPEWAFSSIHRFIRSGIYPLNWSNAIDLDETIEDL